MQPAATSTKKRKHQAAVEDDDEDEDDDDYFPLGYKSPESAMRPVVRKKATSILENVSENETRKGEGIFQNMDEISKLLNT